MIKYFSYFLLLILFTACSGQSASSTEKLTISTEPSVTTALSPSDFMTNYKKETDAQLLDVRTPKEFTAGHLENSLNINYLNSEEFSTETKKLDKTKPVYVYCRSGKRSAAAAKKLEAEGFEKVYDLKGGYIAVLKTVKSHK